MRFRASQGKAHAYQFVLALITIVYTKQHYCILPVVSPARDERLLLLYGYEVEGNELSTVGGRISRGRLVTHHNELDLLARFTDAAGSAATWHRHALARHAKDKPGREARASFDRRSR